MLGSKSFDLFRVDCFRNPVPGFVFFQNSSYTDCHCQWSTQILRALPYYSPCNQFVEGQVSSLKVTKLSVGACAFRLKDLIFLVVAYRSPGRPADVSRRYLPLPSSYLSYSTSDACFMEAPFRWSFLEESSSSAEKWRSVILIVLDRSSFWSVYC